MRWANVHVSLIERAVGIYLEHAWGALAGSHAPPIEFKSATIEQVLAAFTDHSPRGAMRHLSLRLGNRRYPFMKLVLQEPLIPEFFCFSVDTHDQLDIANTTPDYAEWEGIRIHNKQLKAVIESQWHRVGVPVFDDIVAVLEKQSVPENQCCRAGSMPLIHIVDDDASIARGIRVILGKRRFAVEVSHSAEEALAKLPESPPDLVLSDLEMGQGMSGIDFCTKLRKSRGFEDTPFILTTAAGIELERDTPVNVLVKKPFHVDNLVEAIRAALIGTGRL